MSRRPTWGYSGKERRKQAGSFSLCPINQHVHVNWMTLSKKKKDYSSKTEVSHSPKEYPIVFPNGVFLAPERAELAFSIPCSSHLQLLLGILWRFPWPQEIKD